MAIEVGSILEGTVTGITNFGAFVELPEGKTGLAHISEVADVYVNDINDFLKQGQKVKVKVLTINEKGRIGLSLKKAQESAAASRTAEKSADGQASRPAGPRPGSARPVGSRPPVSGGFGRGGGRFSAGPQTFEDKLSKFLKDSDERLTDLKRKMDSKRGGRGARRSD